MAALRPGRLRRPDSIRLLLEPRDIWTGVYWTRTNTALVVYVCLLPCLPIRMQWWVPWYRRAVAEARAAVLAQGA